jgi:hypothetical protein
MGFSIKDKIRKDIELKKKELSRQELINQLKKNGVNPYTNIERDMVVSEAFLTLNGTCKNVLMIFLLKRKMSFKKGRNPICKNPDEINLTYKELTSEPFNLHQQQVARAIKTLLARGFFKVVYQGGAYKKDKTEYGISENWRIWKAEMDFSPKKKDVKRGYQGKGLGVVAKLQHAKK